MTLLAEQQPLSQTLIQALAEHKDWVGSEGSTGQEFDFHKWMLIGADLPGADFSSAKLAGANLRGAELKGSTFKEADLTDTVLTDANLEDADLAEAQGLISEQLGGTNLRRAKLPEALTSFDGLKNVEELAKNAGKLFLSMLLVSAFMLLTIEKTQDVQLLTDLGTAKLPLIDVDISVRAFFGLAPVVLFVLYVAFHLYLSSLLTTTLGSSSRSACGFS